MTDMYTYNERRMLDGIAEYLQENPSPVRPSRRAVAVVEKMVELAGVVEPAVKVVKPESRQYRDNLKRVVDGVAKEYGVGLEDLKRRTNEFRIVRPRQVAMYVLRHKTGVSLKRVGQYFGKHHTTVIHAVEAVELRAKNDAYLRRILKRLCAPEAEK